MIIFATFKTRDLFTAHEARMTFTCSTGSLSAITVCTCDVLPLCSKGVVNGVYLFLVNSFNLEETFLVNRQQKRNFYIVGV